MAKIKGFYKGFKFISHIFGVTVVKEEREMDIGYPTDVKHVAHVGWDGQSGSAPSWMKEFRTSSDFAATSIGNINETKSSHSAISTWSSQDFESMDRQPASEMFSDTPPVDIPNIPKSQTRKKSKSTSTPIPWSRSSRSSKSKAKLIENNVRAPNVEVM